MPRSMIAGLCGKSVFLFVRNCQVSSKCLYHFACPPSMNETSVATPLPAFGVVSVPDFGQSSSWIVVSHCCFNLHFPDDIWCGAPFHILFAILSSLVRCLLRSLTHFFIGLCSYCWLLRVLCKNISTYFFYCSLFVILSVRSKIYYLPNFIFPECLKPR